MQELLGKAAKASRAFEARHGRQPTAEELAPELGVDASRIKDAWEAVTNPRSLDQPVGDADGGTLSDVVEVGCMASCMCAGVLGCLVVKDAVHDAQHSAQQLVTRMNVLKML
jgi:hypothetical protein